MSGLRMCAIGCCAVLLASTLMAAKAHACSCNGRAECGAFHAQDTLFVGKAVSVRVVEVKEASFTRRQRVYSFEVSEALVGGIREARTVEVETGMGGGDCGYGFQIGESYLVDAYGHDGRLSAGICGGTRPLIRAAALLREVHTELAGGRQPDLTGTVWTTDALGSGVPPKPLAGIDVHVTPLNGNAYTVRTDEDGIYTFSSLPPAVYGIQFDLPPHRVSMDASDKKTPTVTIPPSGGVGAACHRDTTALPSGTISGQVVDVTGKGLQTMGVVNLLKPGASHSEPVAAYLEGDGRFTLNFVPDGEYKVTFERWAPKRETFMESDEAHPAGTVTVQDGQGVDGVKIVVK